MSLSYYYEINPSTDILKCIEELLYKEDKCFNNILKNWKDIRRNHNDSFPNFWCYGAPGILLARKEIFDKTNIGNNDLSIIKNVPKFQVEVSHPKEIHLATCSPSIF
ncbi:Lanthionine biosynthesis protein LanM [Streptococcus pneumoniae]|nr:hypothetical protein [Streptococcus pneumoniae]MDV8318711.1 hypothetical protein [Streptococcus pneumoniae]MDV8462340.1 hypothetical protein [Streptococcus pneumoniae]SNJ15963.1 Lanthionine biosynthesis protein LanM [Streptococcus pneumoniae]SNJ16352.1 Lanthionine biosynthesis protein LanM [Streptococcus pneumoniae]